eukprot:CAMPEP_0204130762 /NCGR_PEP_ID=MMETSP0361-20130328/13552_1 /ASSEMBLY_ACC=CAM_ASM_000343 /TAXON_ID=268821 /ORGANISM="Scrippsiella Hangoei, Strain SHTV-5" /LENGTH=479 /DNA_ID=CAMNT_0051083403 /DNA_START=63 /DNA_END=1499 /DNA_ORIENTATION=+
MPFDFENPPVQEGHRQHHTVAPNRWCVTRQDLIEFRCLVKKHVAEGKIAPTELDPFDPNDACIGPCVHTIVKQLIVPVTEKAGNTSWALMLHLDGLECDLFVTHCWLEGIYEFIDKVVNSWPRGAPHAYCCMLSNPQNLDIGHLLSIPRESPFALALMSARYMLVVPNSKCSIYSRIWCAYEAFIAYSESKFIFVATPPLKGALRRVCLLLALSFVTAIASSFLCSLSGPIPNLALRLIVDFVLFCVMLQSFLRPPRAMQVVTHVAAVFGGMCVGYICGPGGDTGSVELWNAIALCVTAAMAEVDRLWSRQSAEEACNLRREYTGDLRDAKSSVESDRENILCELELFGQEQRVNLAIEVLLTSGMSTPTLQVAVENVGLFEQAGYWSLSITLMMWVWWVSRPLWLVLLQSGAKQEQQGFIETWRRKCSENMSPPEVVCPVPECTTMDDPPWQTFIHRTCYLERPATPFANWHFWVLAF